MLSMILVFLNLLRLVLCHIMWSIFENVSCGFEKNMYFASLSMGPLCLCLDLTFPFFPLLSPCPHPTGHCQFVLYFHVSGSILLPGLFVPLIGEIMWYLSFTAWLTSLSIMLSSSIHAVSKGRSSCFLSAA